jgi:hypothetical protein
MGLQGFQRVYRILLVGTVEGVGATVTINAHWDYEEAITVELNAVAAAQQLNHHLSRQKCEAVSFEVVMDAPNSRGMSFDSVALEVGLKQGGRKMAQT